MSTTDVARDIDWVRQGMGEAKISYLGFSYGTYLGAVYGKMYPNKVDRMILDGNVDPTPTQMWYEATLSQNAPVQRRLDSWLNWIAKYDDVYHLGTTTEQVRNAWNNTLADVRTNPRESVGATELLGTVYGAMFSESAWIPLAQALSDFVNEHDASSLVGFASPTNNIASENATASFNAVICSDAAWPTTQTQYESDVAASAQTSQFAWSNMWSSGSACANWAVPHKTRVMPTGENLPPILMFNSVDDPATPYEGARAMHAALPSSVLVTEQNSGKHCVFANPQAAVNPDAQQIGADYLVNGIIPDQDVSVPGHALPVPTPSLAQHSVKAPATSSALMQAE
jgi:pimeloyl-ACP methyl ester carboxylesterase